LRQNLIYVEMALFASKLSKRNKWRALQNVIDYSNEETSNQNNRQEDEVEVGFRNINIGAMYIKRNLDFLEYGFNLVSQAFEELCDVEKGGLMYEKNNISNVKQRANNGKEVGSSSDKIRPKVKTQIMIRTIAINAKRKEEEKDMYMGHPLEIGRMEYSLRLPQIEGKLLIPNLHTIVMLQA
jgi:hypothetical protein